MFFFLPFSPSTHLRYKHRINTGNPPRTRYWIAQGQPNQDFWGHEFSKHATCFSSFDVECYGPAYREHEEVVDFFETAITFFQYLPTVSHSLFLPQSLPALVFHLFPWAGIIPRSTSQQTALPFPLLIEFTTSSPVGLALGQGHPPQQHDGVLAVGDPGRADERIRRAAVRRVLGAPVQYHRGRQGLAGQRLHPAQRGLVLLSHLRPSAARPGPAGQRQHQRRQRDQLRRGAQCGLVLPACQGLGGVDDFFSLKETPKRWRRETEGTGGERETKQTIRHEQIMGMRNDGMNRFRNKPSLALVNA